MVFRAPPFSFIFKSAPSIPSRPLPSLPPLLDPTRALPWMPPEKYFHCYICDCAFAFVPSPTCEVVSCPLCTKSKIEEYVSASSSSSTASSASSTESSISFHLRSVNDVDLFIQFLGYSYEFEVIDAGSLVHFRGKPWMNFNTVLESGATMRVFLKSSIDQHPR